jgi:hypothetical protein
MEILQMDVAPIEKVFDTLTNAGALLGFAVASFFVAMAGYQYMTAGGSVRQVESAKSSLQNSLIGFGIVILSRVIAGMVGNALGAPGMSGTTSAGIALGPMSLTLWLLG